MRATVGSLGADVWSPVNNPASMSEISETRLGFYHRFRPYTGLPGSAAFSSVIPLKRVSVGIAGEGEVFSTYRRWQSVVAASVKLHSNLHLGVGLQGAQLSFGEPYGSRFRVMTSMGLLAKPDDRIRLSFVAHNLTRTTLSGSVREVLPTTLVLGGSVQMHDYATCSLEIRKAFLGRIEAGMDVSVHPVPAFSGRFGVSILQRGVSAGFSYRLGNLELATSQSWSMLLGHETRTSIQIFFGS